MSPDPKMRALMDLIEGDRHIVPTAALSRLGADVLSAVRRAGILRPDDPGFHDLSATDLARTLRSLYGLSSRGRSVPTEFADEASPLGFMGPGKNAREVFLCARPRTGLDRVCARKKPTLVLVPTAREVHPELREICRPGARVEITVLEESLCVLDGRLVLRSAIAPDAPGCDLPPENRPLADARGGEQAPPGAPAGVVLRGIAERWSQMRICLLDPGIVRVDIGRRHVRATAADFGMAHFYTRVPTKEWDVVEELCLHGGYFKTTRFGSADATVRLIGRVAAKLRERVGIPNSPFYPYKRGVGWRSRFEAREGLPED
jgi:hypothetical protein